MNRFPTVVHRLSTILRARMLKCYIATMGVFHNSSGSYYYHGVSIISSGIGVRIRVSMQGGG
jgi:hypothetical protein